MSNLIFSLPATLAIEECEALQQVLNRSAADTGAGSVLTLDAAAVTRLTTPGVQLLCALEKTLTARQAKLQVTGATTAFAEACNLLGLETTYQRWSLKAC